MYEITKSPRTVPNVSQHRMNSIHGTGSIIGPLVVVVAGAVETVVLGLTAKAECPTTNNAASLRS